MVEYSSDVEVEEMSETGEETNSMKEIVLRHISKIGNICCNELTGGYWQKRPIKTGGGVVISETYNPDMREAYCNAVAFLVDIIYPYDCTKDKKYQTYFTTQEQTIDLIQDTKDKIKVYRQIFKKINIMIDDVGFLEMNTDISLR